MAKYLLIESKSPWEARDTDYFYGLARDLAAAGNDVTLFLVQNGVLVAREGAKDGSLAMIAGKVKILADDFSLRERGVVKTTAQVSAANIDVVVDHLAGGSKVVWH